MGEVTVSHTQRIQAQCYRLHAAPPLGALIRIGSPPVFAVVREVWHEPLDPSRPLAPRGAYLETEDELYAANPQLSAMLTTRFTAVIVGYADQVGLHRRLPALPPNLHAFVFACDDAEIAAFVAELSWLRLLLTDASPAADAAIAGCLRRSARATADAGGFLLEAGRVLTAELAGDGRRLQAMLRELAQ